MKKQYNFVYDIKRDCQKLSQEKSFKNLFELICAHGEVPAAEWLENGEIHTLTFNEQRQLADNYAASFAKLIGTSGRVCICMDCCKDWFPVFWGLVRSGHDILTVDAAADDAKLASLMSQADCNILVTAHSRGVECRQILASDLALSPIVTDYSPVWGHNIALCTSGTTADSRIFLYDEETICYLALFSAKVYDENHLLIDNECFKTLAFLPFHHILGFAAIFIWSHFLGDTTVYIKDRTPQTIVETCKRCHVNQIVSVPLLANNICRGLKAEIAKKGKAAVAMVDTMEFISLAVQSVFPRLGLALARKMFSGIQKNLLGNEIKSLVLGGSSTDRRSLRHLNAMGYFTICGFGMTETAINSFETKYRLLNRLKGSIGAPMAYTEYRIKSSGRFSHSGELQIRGKGLHDGRIIDGKILPPEVDAEGWFTTGDVIRIKKFTGEYYILGRIKDVIINESGENVYPDELEESFSGFAGVEQSVILGTKKRGSRYEDITLALNVGERLSDERFLRDLEVKIVRINRTLPVYKRLTRVVVSSEKFPVTSTLKVKRLELRDKIRSEAIPMKNLDITSKKIQPSKQESGEERARQQASEKIRRQMTEIFASVLNIPESKIDPDANIVENLGGDSLQVLSIVSKAEETFGVMIPTESYVACATVNEASALIEKLVYGEASQESQNQHFVIRKPVADFEQSEEYKHFHERIDALLADGAKNPYFVVHESPLLDTSIVNGREMLDFGSYNYVGMSGRKEVSEAAIAAIRKYGTSASGSRLLAGEKPVHGELEREIASWKHSEKALVCVGGHSTNVTVVGNFCGKNDLILYDALAHNSVEQGCRLSAAVARPFPHNDVEALEHILQAQRQYFEKVLIVIEGVYSMDGDISPVPAFVELKKKYKCFLMVDEAHSACVLGATGGGVDEYFSLAPDDVDIKMGTLSKGLGTCGGYLAGKASIIDYLRYNLPGFVFSVGMSPALAAGSLEAVRLLRTRPEIMESLHRNIKCFADEAKKRKLDIGLGGKAAVIPIIVGRDEDAFALSTELENRGILVPPAVYPAVPKNKARLRFDVISEHKPEQIIRALDTLVQAAADLGISLPLREYEN